MSFKKAIDTILPEQHETSAHTTALFSANSTWFTFDAGGGIEFGVYAFSGVEEMHRPFEFEIELVHESAGMDFSELMGQAACLAMADRSGGVRHVHGIIRQFEQLHTANLRTHYRCLLVPRLWYLGLVTDHRIFQDMSVVQIIELILKEQGFAGDSFSFRCFYEYAPRKYCVQFGETSLHFISRLCEEEGIAYYFEHSPQGHVLCFTDREGGPLINGENELRFHPGSGNVTDTAVINRVTLHQSVRSDSATYREWNFQKPKLDLSVSRQQPDPLLAPAPAGMNLEQYRFPHLYQLRRPFLQAREHLVDLGQVLRNVRVGPPVVPAHDQVVGHTHERKQAASFGDVDQSGFDDVFGQTRLHGPAIEEDLTCGGPQQAGNRAQQGGFARAVAADDGHDLPFVHR